MRSVTKSRVNSVPQRGNLTTRASEASLNCSRLPIGPFVVLHGRFSLNRVARLALSRMDDRDLQAHEERALVVVTLSTATLIASVALLIASSI